MSKPQVTLNILMNWHNSIKPKPENNCKQTTQLTLSLTHRDSILSQPQHSKRSTRCCHSRSLASDKTPPKMSSGTAPSTWRLPNNGRTEPAQLVSQTAWCCKQLKCIVFYCHPTPRLLVKRSPGGLSYPSRVRSRRAGNKVIDVIWAQLPSGWSLDERLSRRRFRFFWVILWREIWWLLQFSGTPSGGAVQQRVILGVINFASVKNSNESRSPMRCT